jgi:PHS family inorganic phosphate transporter-like MFS transporter
MSKSIASKDYGSFTAVGSSTASSSNHNFKRVSSTQTTQHSESSSGSTTNEFLYNENVVYEVNQHYYIPIKDCDPTRAPPSGSYSLSYVKRAVKKSSDTVLYSLGFYKNPLLASSLCSVSSVTSEEMSLLSSYQEVTQATDHVGRKLAKRNSSHADMRLSMVSNFSAAYNTVNISLGLTLMKALHPPTHPSDASVCSSALIAGMIVGQLGGGLLGDWLGRHMAMSVVMSLQVASAFWSAWVGLLGFGESVGIYHLLAGCRFVLGIGCGGVYPLAATLTAESSAQRDDRGKLVALTFSMQGVGYLTVSVTAYALVLVLGEDSELAWRLLLGFGCLPGLGLIVVRTSYHRATRNYDVKDVEIATVGKSKDNVKTTTRLDTKSLFQQIRHEPKLLSKILGTAGCWLLFDVLFYGNTLFQPVVFAAAFGNSETVLATVRDSTIISLMALPGYFVSVALVGKLKPKRIQLQGFLIMGLLYAVIGIKFSSLATNRLALILLYGLTFFSSNFGPNTTVSSVVTALRA